MPIKVPVTFICEDCGVTETLLTSLRCETRGDAENQVTRLTVADRPSGWSGCIGWLLTEEEKFRCPECTAHQYKLASRCQYPISPVNQGERS